jgi:hypothetical protein
MGAHDALCASCSGHGRAADIGGPFVAVVPCLDGAGEPGAGAVATHRLGSAGDEQAHDTLLRAACQLIALPAAARQPRPACGETPTQFRECR